jgi:ABC-type lipoprotein export system ATPase subunit
MNVLICSDIHINDYPDYNSSYRSRLGQFDKLSDRLVEIGKENGCEEVWILGDILDKPYSTHHVNHCMKRFMQKLVDNFSKLRYILGQHDLSSKVNNQSEEDTIITLLDFDSDKYINMDQKTLEIDGHLFGFMNWKPKQDLSWLGDKHLDILLGHYTKSEMFGQEIDESKFDLMIHGDIHNDQVIGKFVSVGNPIQHDLKSMANGSCIVLDTKTLKWERIRTDPDHTRFLRINYTKIREKEGFDGDLQYYVYRPEIKSDKTEEEKKLDINDIDKLIVDLCRKNDIENIHYEVESKCEKYSEIDFNFQINSVRICGYRSIVDITVNFSKGDRIALLGPNGSGKSSILNAISDVFRKRNSDIKVNKSDFTEKINVTVSLTYQNKVYEITKGDDWRFLIDGNEQHYGGVREFEEDLPNKLPFLKYIDLFFISSKVNDLSDQFNPYRRIELISKFYRLDRIPAYYKTAELIYKDLKEKYKSLEIDVKSKVELMSYIDRRLLEIDYAKDLDIKDLNLRLEEIIKERDEAVSRRMWENKLDSLERDVQVNKGRVKSVEGRVSTDIDRLRKDLSDMKEESKKVNEAYEFLYKESVKYDSDLKRIEEIEVDGREVRSRLESIEKGKCSECGAPLSDENHKKLHEEYKERINKLLSEWKEVNDRIDKLPNKRNSKSVFREKLNSLKARYEELQKGSEILSNKISSNDIYLKQLENYRKELEESEKSLETHKESELKKVVLRDNLSSDEEDVRNKIVIAKEFSGLLSDKMEKESELDEVRSNIEKTEELMRKYKRYMDLVSLNGIVYEEILRKLAEEFSNDDVIYDVELKMSRGERVLLFNSRFKVKKTYRRYDQCSDGQRTVCDFNFLNNLYKSNVGILTLDEYLKSVDSDNFDRICKIFSDIRVNTIIVSTHDMNMVQYNKRFLMSLNDKEETQICAI